MNEMMWDGASSKLFYRFASPIYSEGKIYLKLNVTSIADGDMELWCLSSKGNYDENRKQVLKIRRGKNELLALLQTEQNDLGAILLKTPSGIKTDASEIKIVSSELIRDYASMQPVNYSLKWLPYIWGTFDENYLAGKIVSRVQLINENIKLNPQSYQEFDIHTSVDKSSGNYLMIRMRPYSKKETQIKLGYGNNEEEAGSFSFSVKADTAFHDYLIRVSSQYNWFMPDISKVNISCGDQSVEVAKLEILQGD
jgi:hypothetical protein